MISLILQVFLLLLQVSLGYQMVNQPKKISNLIEEDVFSYISEIASISLSNISLSITQECTEVLTNAFLTKNVIYKRKFFENSSKMMNDVSSYKDCLFKYYDLTDDEIELIKKNITFVVFFNLQTNFSKFNPEKKRIYGFCLPRGCSEKEYRQVFIYVSNIIFPDLPIEFILAYDMKVQSSDYTIFHLIPVFLLIAISFLSIFQKFIFPKPLKKKNKEENNSNDDICDNQEKSYSSNRLRQMLFGVRDCFALNANCEELMNSQIAIYDVILYDDSGLSVINGVRGFAMIIVVIGVIFETVSISPIISSDKHLMNIFLIPSMAFFLYCQRFGKRLCYCVSGIILMYKMISYLDSEVEYLERKNNTKAINYNLIPMEIQNESFKDYHNKLKWSSFLHFVIKNIYKYILLWFFAIFFKYSLYDIISIFFYCGPLWIYFKNNIVTQYQLSNLFGDVFLPKLKIQLKFSKTNPFNLAINEVNYFLVGIFLIFICYKHNFRMDIIIILGCIICIIGKYILFLSLFEKGIIHDKLYPAKSYLFSFSDCVRNTMSYNLIYFLIGLFIGLINYSLQKPNSKNENKAFLRSTSCIISLFQHKITKYILPLLLVLMCFFVLSYNLLFILLYGDIKDISNFLDDYFINLFYLYDNEMMIITIFFVIFRFFFITESAVISTLKHHYWKCITRPYWIFTITVYCTSNYIFYQSDMKINLDIKCLVFFSILGITTVLIGDAILFILLDVPLKKLTKFIISYLLYPTEEERSTSLSSEHSIN